MSVKNFLLIDLDQSCFQMNTLKSENPIKSNEVSNPYLNYWIGFKIQKIVFGYKTNSLKRIKRGLDMVDYELILTEFFEHLQSPPHYCHRCHHCNHYDHHYTTTTASATVVSSIIIQSISWCVCTRDWIGLKFILLLSCHVLVSYHILS